MKKEEEKETTNPLIDFLPRIKPFVIMEIPGGIPAAEMEAKLAKLFLLAKTSG